VSEATRARLARLLGEEHPDLAEANLLIGAEAHPEVDIGRALDRVDALAARAATGGVVDTLRAEGYQGAVDDYDAPENSLLSDVMERRRGLPIALSTLALAMAQRLELPMAGVGMPGHFILADLRGAEPSYIDPFNGWAPLDVAGCARLVASTTGMPFRREYLAPVPERAILVRTLLNLRGSYMRRRRPRDTLWTVELGLIMAPGDPGLVRDGVVLLAAAGRYAEAEAAAAAFLADRPDDPAAPALEMQLDVVRELRRRTN
jgi:regulator of sirC expression with transglutaminase-like and TPR domain